MNLRLRIALALGAVAAVVGAFAAFGSYITTERQLASGIDSSLQDRAELANGVIQPRQRTLPGGRGDGFPGGSFPRRPGAGANGTDPVGTDANGSDSPARTIVGCPAPGLFEAASAAQIVDASGQISPCIAGARIRIPTDGLSSLGKSEYRMQTDAIDGQTYRVVSANWKEGGYIQIARSLEESDAVLNGLRLRLAGLALIGIVAAAGAGWLIARRIVRPVVRLRRAAESIASTQDLSTPIPIEGVGEVGSLARSFTTMVGALASSREQQTRLVADASHEMRTPLTSLRTNLELLDHFEQLSAIDRSDTLAAAQIDVGELTNLLTELVELAADPTSDVEVLEAVRLRDLVDDAVGRARRRSGRAIEVTPSAAAPDATVTVRPQMLERAIANLVDNAIKYGDNVQPIEIAVDAGSVLVRDHGAGIAANDLAHIFERFYRSTIARTEQGSGLGLAIVRQIVERHGGKVYAGNHPDGGAVVGFILPVDRSVQP